MEQNVKPGPALIGCLLGPGAADRMVDAELTSPLETSVTEHTHPIPFGLGVNGAN